MLAIDEDDISQEALHEAIYLCRVIQAKLRIVHVIDEGVLADLGKVPTIFGEIKEIENAANKFLQSVVKMTHEAGIDPETQFIKITRRDQHIAFEIADTVKRMVSRFTCDRCLQ